jgi:ribonuclease D
MPCRDGEASVSWIADDAALADAVGTWGSVIGLDTEFQRTNTFFPLPGLYQVNAGGRVYLLDPLAIEDWGSFVDCLEDPRVTVVMHACGEDLELMRHHLGAVPREVFDTQFAHAFLSEDFSTSYANLVSRLLGEELPKHETRSDWLQRPLTSEQIRYAWEDVVHLPRLHAVLKQGLEAKGRYEWFRESMRDRGRFEPNDPDEHYRVNKRAWRLGGADLAVLRILTAWRERRAMEEDVPRKRIVWDEHLLEFARTPELSSGDVWRTLPKPIARRYADEIVAEHQQGRAAPALPRLDQPLTQAQGEVAKALRKAARKRAAELGLAEELLARKRDIEDCVRHYLATGELSPTYSGWREQVLGEEFRRLLESLQ